ncbi:MAG: amidohydrolase family protein [Coriobacteriales bacterium]|jgi:imidazolonepropionase-like amidohydrolase|nr:amidohydrolase family protein [Coriobacteriales bacterium]
MILIKNTRVFDGFDPKLTEHASIVIDGSHVREITQEAVNEENFEKVIDAENRVAIPGLIDAHVHLHFAGSFGEELREDEIVVHSTRFAKEVLLRGFTTVRDAFGAVYGLKAGIDKHVVDGPRIFPSYAAISQTSGHGDMRSSRTQVRTESGLHPLTALRRGDSVAIADGVPEVLRATRDQLFLGASQIKTFTGGGLSSKFDPLFGLQYTFDELKAIVETTRHFGTYVMAHVYGAEGIRHAVEAGIQSIEHGVLLDEETAKLVKDRGVWFCTGPQFGKVLENVPPGFDKILKDYEILHRGEEIQSELINKYDIPILYGTDAIRDDSNRPAATQLADFGAYKRRFGSLKGLRSATGNFYQINRELCTGQQPYPEGKIGVLEKGSFADLLLVDGNPVEDLDVLTNVDNIRVIIKDGVTYKNTIEGS